MAIKNFSLTGVGQTVTFGKGGGTITSSGSNLQIGGSNITTASTLATYLSTNNYATETYVNTQVQAFAAGLDFKNSVRVATTANITTTGTQTIDGVAVIAGDRVLVKNQTTGSQNGIYIVAAGAWSRASDASATGSITGGTFVFVEEGTTQEDTSWVVSTNGTITIGTTAIAWSQFGAGGGSAPTAGNGISVSGTTVTANVDGVTLTNVGGTGTQIAVRGGTTGQVLKSAGAGADATWGTIAFSEVTSKPTTLSGYGITDAQPLDGDLTSIAGLAGTSGLLRKTAANTWSLDTATYLTSLSGAVLTNGTAPLTADWNVGGFNVTGLAAPTIDSDAATKEYVDDAIAAGSSSNTGRILVAKSTRVYSAEDAANTGADLLVGSTIHRVIVKVTQAFNGTTPTLTIGYTNGSSDPDAIDDGTGFDLTTIGTYVVDSYFEATAAADVTSTLTIGGTPTTGELTIIVEYSHPEA